MAIAPGDTGALLEALKAAASHLEAMARKLEFPWDPTLTDPRKLHTMYVRNLVCAYVSKYSELTTSIVIAAKHDNFLVYALCGRALIESVATLRYYVRQKYTPLMAKGALNCHDMEELIRIDDAHLRGSRFNWEAFLFKQYSKLKDEVVSQLREKKGKVKVSTPQEAIIAQQVNVLTCIEKWAEETPEVMIAYNLFCDLVHPNIGSAFLVASTTKDHKLYFTRSRGRCVGRDIFEQSLPILASVAHKPFGEYLTLLIATGWSEDET